MKVTCDGKLDAVEKMREKNEPIGSAGLALVNWTIIVVERVLGGSS
jgi:hypothetical protein